MDNTEEPKRREWDRRYREKNREQRRAADRERARVIREKVAAYDREHGL
jgi:hypothetical protein